MKYIPLIVALLAGCAADPAPIRDGAEVATPHQCIEAQKRGEINC